MKYQEGDRMNLKRNSFDKLLLLAAFVLGAGLRFFQLGTAPLTETEAVWANQALEVAYSADAEESGTNLTIGPQPAYVLLTGVIFAIFGDSNFTARFLSALAGSLLVMAPILLFPKFKSQSLIRLALIFLAFGLAIDPGLVTISRQAGSPMMAVSFSILALAAWYMQFPVFAGISTGIALLSGPSFYALAVSLVFTGLFLRFAVRESDDPLQEGVSPAKQRRLFFIAAIITFLSVGTLLGRYPQGIAAWLSSIQVYLAGWIQTASIPPFKMVLALLVYEMLPVTFFLIGIASGLVNRRAQLPNRKQWLFLAVGALFSLLLALAYPGRQVVDLTFSLVFIWSLAALVMAFELVPYGDDSSEDRSYMPISFLLASFIFILMALFWFTLSALSRYAPATAADNIRWLVPAGALALIILTSTLVSLGWSARTGVKGFFWGITSALLVYNFAVLWGAAYLRPNQPVEFLSLSPGPGQASMMRKTLDSISIKETGFTGFLEIISSVDSQSLRWALRDYQNTRFITQPGPADQPAVVITSDNQDFPALSAAYSGQDFVWWTWQGWSGAVPPNFIRWFNYREAPTVNQKIILWVRADIIQNDDFETVSEEEIKLPGDEAPLP